MIILDDNRLEVHVPEVHPDARRTIEFQRTLRIPDDGRDYPLPPGPGRFPLRHLDDFALRLPEPLRERGGVVTPVHQAGALWISFSAGYPFAARVATGRICAITGDPWTDGLNRDPQDYAVLPEQPWLDGCCVEEGVFRQFVTMPLGSGYTVEEQLSGAAMHGGIQFLVCPMKAGHYGKLGRPPALRDGLVQQSMSCTEPSMGLAPGGRMHQDIYDDPHGLDAWDQRHASRCFVPLVNASQWLAVTGERPPTEPPGAQDYAAAGLPRFAYDAPDAKAVAGSERLRGAASVAAVAARDGHGPRPGNGTVTVGHVREIGERRRRPVRETSGDGATA